MSHRLALLPHFGRGPGAQVLKILGEGGIWIIMKKLDTRDVAQGSNQGRKYPFFIVIPAKFVPAKSGGGNQNQSGVNSWIPPRF